MKLAVCFGALIIGLILLFGLKNEKDNKKSKGIHDS
jgi:hypothetical protein